MKHQVALLLMGCVAFSSASGYNSHMRKTLQPIPIPKNYQQQLAAAPAPLPGAGAPGSDFGAGAPGAPALEEIEHHEQQSVQVLYKAPTRVVERQPIRIAPSTYTRVSDDAPPPRRGYAGHGGPKKPLSTEEDDEQLALEEEFNEAARSAKYSFASAVDDGIQDQSHIRQETRDGLKVTGTYAYSDGYFKRTVNYEADENGYRVVAETVEPLGEDGPQVDLVNGKAEVRTQIGGVDTQYSVSADELNASARRYNLNKQED